MGQNQELMFACTVALRGMKNDSGRTVVAFLYKNPYINRRAESMNTCPVCRSTFKPMEPIRDVQWTYTGLTYPYGSTKIHEGCLQNILAQVKAGVFK